MRKISGKVTVTFSVIISSILALSFGSSYLLGEYVFSAGIYGVGILLSFVFFFYMFSFTSYQIFLKLACLEDGYIEIGSHKEFWANLNILFYLLIFNTFVRTNILPVPLMRLVYVALGTKMGNNTFSAGAILDPPLTCIGHNTLIGHNAVLFSHVIEKNHFSFEKIQIGSNVTVGANAIIMPGVRVGDHSIIATGSLIKKGTIIGDNEVWAGVPARKITSKKQQTKIRSIETASSL